MKYKGIIRYVGIGILLFMIWNLMLGYFPFLLCLLYVILLLFSYMISLKSMKKSHITIHCDSHVFEQKQHIYVTFRLQDSSYIHCGMIEVCYGIYDHLGHLMEERKLIMYDEMAMDMMTLEHCGYYEIKIISLQCYDILQCFFKKNSNISSQYVYIFPLFQDYTMHLEKIMSNSEDAHEYSPDRKGDDYSEIFDLKQYQQSDSLKYIHWKASLKKNELYVKNGSLPITSKITLALADQCDQAYQILYSIGLSFLRRQIPFEILCPTLNHHCFDIEMITNQDFFQECLKRLMKTTPLSLQESLKSYHKKDTLYQITSQGIEVKNL